MSSFDPNGLGNLRPETQALHAGQVPDPTTKARAVPIYATTSYVFDDAAHAARLFGLQEFGNIYTRIMNPTTGVFEERVAALEGGVGALALASGQAAETLAILNLARAGQNIVSSSSLYGGTYNLFHYTLPKLGHHDDVRGRVGRGQLRRRRSTRTRAPCTRDDRQPAPRRRRHRCGEPPPRTRTASPLIVDNTFAPILTRPFELRRGHRDPLGHQVDRRPRHRDRRRRRGLAASSTGPPARASTRTSWRPTRPTTAVSYTEAFGTAGVHPQAPRRQGLRDLGVRALAVERLAVHPGPRDAAAAHRAPQPERARGGAVAPGPPRGRVGQLPGARVARRRTRLPGRILKGGYGGMITFGIKGGVEAGQTLIDSVKLFSLLANVGDAKSLIIHPASTTHQQLTDEEQATTGVTDGPDPAVDRHRAHRRHPRRPRPGAPRCDRVPGPARRSRELRPAMSSDETLDPGGHGSPGSAFDIPTDAVGIEGLAAIGLAPAGEPAPAGTPRVPRRPAAARHRAARGRRPRACSRSRAAHPSPSRSPTGTTAPRPTRRRCS